MKSIKKSLVILFSLSACISLSALAQNATDATKLDKTPPAAEGPLSVDQIQSITTPAIVAMPAPQAAAPATTTTTIITTTVTPVATAPAATAAPVAPTAQPVTTAPVAGTAKPQ